MPCIAASCCYSITHLISSVLHPKAKNELMADGPSSVTTTNPRPSTSSLPTEYQVRPSNLPKVGDSPLSGIAAHPYRQRSIWYELWKSKMAFILFVTSTSLIYFDYQRTQRYKAQKALKSPIEEKKKPL